MSRRPPQRPPSTASPPSTAPGASPRRMPVLRGAARLPPATAAPAPVGRPPAPAGPPPVSLDFILDEADATSIEPLPDLAADLGPLEDTAPSRIPAPPGPRPAPKLRLPLPAEPSPSVAPSRLPDPFEDDTPPPASGRPRSAPSLGAPPPPTPAPPTSAPPALRLPVPSEASQASGPVPPAMPKPALAEGFGQVLSTLETHRPIARSAPNAGFVLRLPDEDEIADTPAPSRREFVLFAVLIASVLIGVIWKGPSLGVVDPEERVRLEQEARLLSEMKVRADEVRRLRSAAEAQRRSEAEAQLRALRERDADTLDPLRVEPWEAEPPKPEDAPLPTAPAYGYGPEMDGKPLPGGSGEKHEASSTPTPPSEPPPVVEEAPPPDLPIEGNSSGFFTIMSQPSGALIEVEGRVLGKTPFVQKIDAFTGRGALVLTLKLKGRRTWKGVVTPNESGHYQLKAELGRK